jgi:hypothetical protein
MTVAEWLDDMAADGKDMSGLKLPEDLAYDADSDEVLFFREIKPCGFLCTQEHPFAMVERFDHWYYARGRDKGQTIHSAEPQNEWGLFTKDKQLAMATAKAHIEGGKT